MIDWHSHILPGVDDGSHNVAESIALLNMHQAQGIDTVIATPHFYANDETADSFLLRRKESYDQLKEELTDGLPEIVLGAEVRYYQGISRMDGLKKLRIEGSKLLLLEMPMSAWTEYMVRELVEMAGRSSTRIILAHIERYLDFQKDKTFDRLFESGILMQSNASFFNSVLTKRKALKLLEKGHIQFVGSDCHSVKTRPPAIGKAYEIIGKKFGEDFISQMDDYGHSLLEKITNR